MLSKFGFDFLTNCHRHLKVEGDDDPDIQFRRGSYVYLVNEKGEQILRENYQIQW